MDKVKTFFQKGRQHVNSAVIKKQITKQKLYFTLLVKFLDKVKTFFSKQSSPYRFAYLATYFTVEPTAFADPEEDPN